MSLATLDSLIAVLDGLLNKCDDITANNGLNYNTTRLSNTIVELRKCGIKIVNKTIKTPNNKRYDKYYLEFSEANVVKAKTLLNFYIQSKKWAKKVGKKRV
ncbi:helix-turn-helix domain-containing protein [Campylobacter lanienae]|uniref:helix-turn-helix domain-containing protein n=1 Tax=Campylobacter lanienae TaxID=75658 RepID=UPI000BB43536|nr:helix-turn-helix domain-containing protein [Campylobacter lanienae]